MKGKKTNESPSFIPYDDDNLSHVSCGPDYGQPWSSSNAWNETSSKEYTEYVAEIVNKILNNKIRVDSDPSRY